ncbi:hypothetical protein ACJ72_05920 [Emergomyces africanus]|uniref:Uncharacterized protein n=1 Tax=Emergomyces africanus TaxID=1955775 RepID=A0A1B7NSI9_9EURO|nr:hypothetical protein ACJ72_05920 [Emergomyces africanus]
MEPELLQQCEQQQRQQQWITRFDESAQLPFRRLGNENNDYKMPIPPHFIRIMAAENLSSPGRRSYLQSSFATQHGNPRRQRMQELSKLGNLRTDISGLVEELKSQAPTAQSPHAFPPNKGEESILELSTQPEDVHSHSRLSQSLPKSPIVTRLERRANKLKPRANQQDMDRLKYNPWAQLLASPVRMCTATGARIPEKLLGNWGLVQHPETQGLWLMPVDLVKEELQRASVNSAPSLSEACDDVPEEHSVPPPPSSPPAPRSSFPSFYMTNSAELLDTISSMKVSLQGRLVPSKWKSPKGPLPRKMNFVFRRDMAVFFLARMRERVLLWLKKAKGLRPLGEQLGDWTVLDTGTQAIGEGVLRESLQKLGDLEHAAWGAVFISRRAGGEGAVSPPLGGKSAGGKDSSQISSTSEAESTDESTSADPTITLEPRSESTNTSPELPKFIDLPATGSIVPVFDLTTLLTGEQLETLRQYADIFQHPAVFYRPGDRAPVSMISWLWSLKIYMMKYDKS